MSTPVHPGRTKAQRRVLDEIGCGNYAPRMSLATRTALLAAGLIEQCGNRVLGRDSLGVIAVPEYQMPVNIHYQWCKAVASEPGDEP